MKENQGAQKKRDTMSFLDMLQYIWARDTASIV